MQAARGRGLLGQKDGQLPGYGRPLRAAVAVTLDVRPAVSKDNGVRRRLVMFVQVIRGQVTEFLDLRQPWLYSP